MFLQRVLTTLAFVLMIILVISSAPIADTIMAVAYFLSKIVMNFSQPPLEYHLTSLCQSAPTFFPITHDPELLYMCVIYSGCDGGPTFGISMNTNLFGCLAENPAVLASTGGTSAIFSAAANAGLE